MAAGDTRVQKHPAGIVPGTLREIERRVPADEAPPLAPNAKLAWIGKSVTTLEGLGSVVAQHPVQAAFIKEQAAQCGYCTSGMIMSAVALLTDKPKPTEEEVRSALDGHLCRCGTIPHVIDATLDAAKAMKG